ncbi:MAG TPA: response regulator [Opitutaceae bacterium]|nr:response regulator [Opitutaceae bacterium]
MKILLVEDHPALAEISCSQLRELHDHEVCHVDSGGAALAAVQSFQPELILLDIHLPDMTGYDIARQVRVDPQRDAVVIVALTGFGSQVDPKLAAEAGIDVHFRKPMDFELLPTLQRRVSPTL